jgi:hypothetical protein
MRHGAKLLARFCWGGVLVILPSFHTESPTIAASPAVLVSGGETVEILDRFDQRFRLPGQDVSERVISIVSVS